MATEVHYALFLGGLCSAAALLVFLGLHYLYPKRYLRLWLASAGGFLLYFVAELLARARLFDSAGLTFALLFLGSLLWNAAHVFMLGGLFELRRFEQFPARIGAVGLAASGAIDLLFVAWGTEAAISLARAEAFCGALAAGVAVYLLLRPRRAYTLLSVAMIFVLGGVAALNILRAISIGDADLVSTTRAFGYGLTALGMLLLVFAHEHEAASVAASHVELLAYHDSLTGLPNRSLFFDRLVLTLAQADRFGHRAAVLFFDLDRFKQVNDSLGHNVGDALIKKVAERISSAIRLGDTLARFGGDEFTLLIGRVDSLDQVVAVARKVVENARREVEIHDRKLAVSASVGISIFPDDATDAEALIRNADAAMYRAKENGGDRYELYSPAMRTAALARLEVESGLRQALEKNELELLYQPLIDLKDHSIFGMEALLSWQSPELGQVNAERFIETADISGLSVPMAEWMLAEACRHTAAWQREHGIELTVSMRLSPRQFTDRRVIDFVRHALDETRLRPGNLELEISESCAMHDPEKTIATMRELKSTGVRLALDGFGTGHSSLHYLQRFPIDTLKVDRAFVADVTSRREGSIVKALIDLAHSLGLRVVADGVENEKQLAALGAQFCDVVQGYLFSAPLRAAELTNFIRQHKRLVGPASPSWNVEKLPDSSLRNVLVVDDDAAIRILVQKMLERARFNVDVAQDGMEAVAKLREHDYAAVFLDIMMPRLDGFGVIDFMKREKGELLRNTVVMTAISPAALQRVAAEPVARILPKPFDVAQIIATANECALRQRAG